MMVAIRYMRYGGLDMVNVRRMLIVDDEQAIAAMLGEYFELQGYTTIVANSAAEALAAVDASLRSAAARIDIVLLDVNMPGMDGFELCRRMRSLLSCPIIFLTARVEDADQIDGFAAGGDDYVVKPFSLDLLGERVRAHLMREDRRATPVAAQRALWGTAEERRRLNAAFAHDLRTPLTVLKGTVEMMRLRAERAALPAAGQRDAASPAASGDAEDDLHEKMLASIDVLAGQVTRLEDYCRAITSVTKLEDRTVDRRETGYVQLAENLARFARALVEASGLACSFAASSEHPLPIDDPGRVRVFVDEALVEEALGNLIANACRFAVQTVGIEVTLIHLAERGQQRMCLQVKVADDGPGFSADALRHGCEAFFSEQKSAEHFGLGLSIASMLARLHGGGITLANADGGAVATVLIDVSRQP